MKGGIFTEFKCASYKHLPGKDNWQGFELGICHVLSEETCLLYLRTQLILPCGWFSAWNHIMTYMKVLDT